MRTQHTPLTGGLAALPFAKLSGDKEQPYIFDEVLSNRCVTSTRDFEFLNKLGCLLPLRVNETEPRASSPRPNLVPDFSDRMPVTGQFPWANSISGFGRPRSAAAHQIQIVALAGATRIWQAVRRRGRAIYYRNGHVSRYALVEYRSRSVAVTDDIELRLGPDHAQFEHAVLGGDGIHVSAIVEQHCIVSARGRLALQLQTSELRDTSYRERRRQRCS